MRNQENKNLYSLSNILQPSNFQEPHSMSDTNEMTIAESLFIEASMAKPSPMRLEYALKVQRQRDFL